MKGSISILLAVALSLLLICSLSCTQDPGNKDAKAQPPEEDRGMVIIKINKKTHALSIVNAGGSEHGPNPECTGSGTPPGCCYPGETARECFERIHENDVPVPTLVQEDLLKVDYYKGSCYYVIYDAAGRKIFVSCD